jgi:pyruvate,water dikinase
MSENNISQIQNGDVIYIPTSVSTENNVMLFYKLAKSGVGAILCEKIERTDHGVLLVNELNIPCISDINYNLRDYDGNLVTCRGDEIYIGNGSDLELSQTSRNDLSFPRSQTEIKINLGFPEVLKQQPELSKVSEGVGFMRIEFLLLDILENLHPKEYVKRYGRETLEDQLAERIEPVVRAYSAPVWIRTDDFAVTHLRQMEFGNNYENEESNSMLGWRGISRSIDDPFLFDIQISAINKLIDLGYQNIGLFPPMTRLPSEYVEWKTHAEEAGLTDISFGLMVETPAVALTIEQFTDDIEFVVFGSNDLTQFTLAIDRSNEKLQSKFDEKQDAVIELFRRVIDASRKNNIKTCIGGQAASDPELVHKLIGLGIDSLSVNPDFNTISNIMESVVEIEN